MMRDEDTEMTETPQVGPREQQQTARFLGLTVVTQLMGEVKDCLGSLGPLAQTLDMASRILAIQGDEKKMNVNTAADDEGVAALLHNRIMELERENEVLARSNADFKAGLNQMNRESQNYQFSLQADLEGKNKIIIQQKERIYSLQDEVDKIHKKEVTLRQIVLDKAGNEKVSDQAMISKFAALRHKIHNLARHRHYQMDQSPSKQKMNNSGAVGFFGEKTWGCLTTEDRINRVRSEMFDIIHTQILNGRMFGVEGPVAANDSSTPVASELRRFENVLYDNRVSAGLISDWRISTIKCIDKLDYQSTLAFQISGHIFGFFQPLFAKQVSQSDTNEVLGKIKEVCEEAVDLGMLMRRSRDLYMVKVPGKDLPRFQKACGELLVQPMGVEGGKGSEASDEIAHTLFGALVKQPEHGDGRQLVLEVAHVILKKEEKRLPRLRGDV